MRGNLKSERNKQKFTPKGGKEKGWKLVYSYEDENLTQKMLKKEENA